MPNPRDESLCQCLLSFGFLSSEQIKKLVFPTVDKRTMLRRLRVLKKKKVLNRFESSKGGTVLWSLTARQSSLMGSDFVMRNINRSALEHDLLVNELRIQFEANGMGTSWKSSHYLRFKASQGLKRDERLPDTIPDWLVTIEGKLCAVEVELSFKGILRMERIFNLYADKKSIHQLWYFVPTEKMRQKILWLANGYSGLRGKNWIRVSLLSELTPREGAHTRAHSVSSLDWFKLLIIRIFSYFLFPNIIGGLGADVFSKPLSTRSYFLYAKKLQMEV